MGPTTRDIVAAIARAMPLPPRPIRDGLELFLKTSPQGEAIDVVAFNLPKLRVVIRELVDDLSDKLTGPHRYVFLNEGYGIALVFLIWAAKEVGVDISNAAPRLQQLRNTCSAPPRPRPLVR